VRTIKNINIKISSNAKLLLSIFLPLYAIKCVEQVYFVYGNVIQAYGFLPQATGVILGSFYIAISIFTPVGGWMLENMGVRRTLALSSIASFAGCAMLFFSQNFPMLLAGRLLAGAASGVFSMALYSYQALSVTEKMRGASFAITVTGGMLPTATVTPAGEWLLSGGRLGAYLAVGPVLSVICFLLGRRVGVGKAASETSGKNWGSYRDLVSIRPFVMLVATGTAMAFVDAATVSISLFAAENQIIASYFLASSSIAAVIVRLAGAPLMNRLPRSFCVGPCGMLMCGALLVVSTIPSNASFLLCGAIFGIGIGFGFPILLAALSDTLLPELRPKGTSTAIFLYNSGWVATPLLVGWLTPVLGLAHTFLALSLVAFSILAALLIFYWIPCRGDRPRQHDGFTHDAP
jgi:MFS family permease